MIPVSSKRTGDDLSSYQPSVKKGNLGTKDVVPLTDQMEVVEAVGQKDFFALPVEIAHLIFGYLKITEFCTNRRVCKRWKTLIEQSSAWKKFATHMSILSFYFHGRNVFQVEQEWKNLSSSFACSTHFQKARKSLAQKCVTQLGRVVYPTTPLHPMNDVIMLANDRGLVHYNLKTSNKNFFQVTFINSAGTVTKPFRNPLKAKGYVSLVGNEYIVHHTPTSLSDPDFALHMIHLPTNTTGSFTFHDHIKKLQDIESSLGHVESKVSKVHHRVLNDHDVCVCIKSCINNSFDVVSYYIIDVTKRLVVGVPVPDDAFSSYVEDNGLLAIEAGRAIHLFDLPAHMTLATLFPINHAIDRFSRLQLLGIHRNRIYCLETETLLANPYFSCFEIDREKQSFSKKKIEIAETNRDILKDWLSTTRPENFTLHFFAPHILVTTEKNRSVLIFWNLDTGQPFLRLPMRENGFFQLVGDLLFYEKSDHLVAVKIDPISKQLIEIATYPAYTKLVHILDDGIVTEDNTFSSGKISMTHYSKA